MGKAPPPTPDPVAALAASDLFSDAQRATLRALCDTFIPALEPPAGDEDQAEFWGRAASDLAVPEGLEVALLGAGLADEQMAGLRSLLDQLAANGMAAETPREARERIVLGFSDAGPDALAGITTLRALGNTLFYAAPDPATGRNPNWETMGFPGPLGPAPSHRDPPLRVRRVSGSDETVEADACVVGSGAGGGVIAAELAAAGKSVVVLEAGDYLDDADFDGLELSAYQRMYMNGGPFPTAEGRSRSLPARASAAGRSSTGPTACGLRTTCAPSGRRSTGSRTWPNRATTSTSTRCSSACG